MKQILLLLILISTFTYNYSIACTGIRLNQKDGSIVYARTLEFGFYLDSDVIVIPRNYELIGSTSSGNPGVKWNSKYAVVGTNGGKQTIIVDGVNEKGLAGGLFYFPGYADYQPVAKEEENKSLAPTEILMWILTNFENVDEVKKGLETVRVGNVKNSIMKVIPPAHFIIHDNKKSIVVEYVNGELKIHDNPIGIITNSPAFDWHLTNLKNYVNLTATNVPQIDLDGVEFAQFGQGSGMLGLPGDFTPPSRFVRATFFSLNAVKSNSATDGILQAFHILNNFDIPKGSIKQKKKTTAGDEYTQWTSANDLKNKRFFFKTAENSQIRMVDLMKFDLDAKEIVAISMKGEEKIQELK